MQSTQPQKDHLQMWTMGCRNGYGNLRGLYQVETDCEYLRTRGNWLIKELTSVLSPLAV